MDNRLDNLCLIDIRNAHVWYTRANAVKASSSLAGNSSSAPSNDKSSANDLHLTLYWAAIQQLPPEQQTVNGAGSSGSIQTNEVRNV